MDLTPENIGHLLYAIAGLNEPSSFPTNTSHKTISNSVLTPWSLSTLNPKNRIDGLDGISNSKWRIDGSAGLGTQFYTIPTFIEHLVPIRIDTFIPPSSEIPTQLHEVLDLSTALSLRDARVSSLGISHYIVRVLSYWSNQFSDFETFYTNLPFGSRIMFENIDIDIRSVRIQVVQTHFLERQFLSKESLQTLWNFNPLDWPDTIDISCVHLLRQLHDSVSLARINDQIYILKTLTSSPKYLYHELKVLLSKSPHPNIIAKPKFLVTKACKFGGKSAVIGIVLPYHRKGTLRDILPFRRIHGSLQLRDQIKWATQLTEALIHLKNDGIMYCDLRLDNVVLESDNDGIVMIDFESRGVATFMSAPEIMCLEYIYSLSKEPAFDDSHTRRFKQMYNQIARNTNLPTSTEIYRNPDNGYCVSWLCLTEREKENAQVYMLGRVLWCIFEGVASPEKSVIVQHLREDELEFPNWERTPKKVRELVTACCASDTGHHRFALARKGNLLKLREGDGTERPEDVRRVALNWWKEELSRAEEFVRKRVKVDDEEGEGCINYQRPTLGEVLSVLKTLDGVA